MSKVAITIEENGSKIITHIEIKGFSTVELIGHLTLLISRIAAGQDIGDNDGA